MQSKSLPMSGFIRTPGNAMCDWLTSDEWYDVYLLCGGRHFRARRAVLASVSKFLRKVLLSCPSEDAPIFIALPEFDHDTMFLVLYYIYNGEVVIQEKQLENFLDIINAMQIFIDSQYISENSNIIQKDIYKTELYRQNVVLKSVKPVTNNGRKDCVNLQGGVNLVDVLNNMQRSLNTDLEEDYQEGYASVGGVLEILNEGNRKPTSVLLANANAEDLRTNVTVLNNSCNRTDGVFISLLEWKERHLKTYDEKCDTNLYNNCRFQTNVSQNVVDIKCMHTHSILRNMENEKDNKQDYFSKHKATKGHNFQETAVNLEYFKSAIEIDNKLRSNVTKMTIFNKVLQCPWKSRLPYNYRPCSKKSCDLWPNAKDSKIVQQQSSNDKNNNFNCVFSDVFPQKHSKQISALNLKCSFCEQVTFREPLICNTGIEINKNTSSQVFSDTGAFDAHIKQHTPFRYTCQECNKSFSQLRNYKYHMSVHRGTKEFATTCPVCGKYFNDKGYLSSHLKIHRNRKEYKCAMCPKSFNQRVAYNMHVRIHTGLKPHLCDKCGIAFSRKMLLKQHQRTHSGERPYACSHCDKRFADRSNMTLHLRLHTGVKPFSCSLCPKSFTKKHHLKSHLNFHTGAKPYSCPRCQVGFTQSSNMRTHMKKCNALQQI